VARKAGFPAGKEGVQGQYVRRHAVSKRSFPRYVFQTYHSSIGHHKDGRLHHGVLGTCYSLDGGPRINSSNAIKAMTST